MGSKRATYPHPGNLRRNRQIRPQSPLHNLLRRRQLRAPVRPPSLSRTPPKLTISPRGWLLSDDWQDFLIQDDEYDEFEAAGVAADGYAVTYIWDISNLEAPKQTGYYKSKVHSIDHNQYIHDGMAYQSNYGAGFRVLDVSSIRDGEFQIVFCCGLVCMVGADESG